ncbi:metallophosphoesterase family protein [Clostridium sp.]|uniref:metallophosphoesterase family protein n=1 Tax=Clostridium sp. TaxID=1506 RepID=UPI00257CB5C8|nr:metallophosphoesterase family protein [Clostridium sp.]
MFKLMKIAVLSDIHGNMEAFREVVKYLEKEQIKKVLILGDIIDYGPHSNEVITCLMDLPWEIIGNIRGNHEEAVIEQKYDMFSSDRGRKCAENTRRSLNEQSWYYLNTRMEPTASLEIELEGKKCLAIHGSLKDEMWVAVNPEQDLMEYKKYDYVFSGHSHLPCVFGKYYDVDNKKYRNKKRTMFINPGSVGQPRNHNPRAQFVLWDTETDEFRMCAVNYDIKKEQQAFSGKIDDFYKNRLQIGI